MSGYTVKIRGAVGSAKQREYLCDQCGRFDHLVADPPPDAIDCPACGTRSERLVSAPPVHTQFVVSATQGKSAPKPHHLSLDTRPLGEGQKFSEWKQERAKLWEADRKRRVMEALK